ncbi:ROK family protein [Cysteiniphilum halobium]|uniref:ROK family protein n=1 Tax=Cysteiniphilum halobium TaxID=2219059 RepID=UPI000E65621A|nr:ROK family protein [Cysteiniphilum halobium]
MHKFLGAIEAGGTKFVCAIGTEDGKILQRIRIKTRTPAETMPEIIGFFREYMHKYPLSAIGCGSFGPIDPDVNSKTYGYITHTPKLPWRDYNIVKHLEDGLHLPVAFDTDVNSAALGEHRWGAGKGVSDLIYLTVGTGVGGGIIVNNQLVHGSAHPEMGHIYIPVDLTQDTFKGICPYHERCLEGLASGPALKTRWQVDSALDLADDHIAWHLETEYLSYALVNYIMCFMPKRIILGGGVMKQTHLFKEIHNKVKAKINGYLNKDYCDNIPSIIVPPALADNAGIMGALALASTVTKITPQNPVFEAE